ncbi:MAG: NAD(P) transhydrogenase subunit alpha [Opitutales bacterium]
MQIFVPRECENETRVAVTPDTVKKFIQLGITIQVESGCGLKSLHTDEDYVKAGAQIISTSEKKEALQAADLVLHVLPLEASDIAHMKPKAWHVSFFDTFRFPEQLEAFKQNQTNVISLERIPRTSFAQKMDALSSQSSLAGYVSVMEGLRYLPKTLPMMVTPAGTLQAARVFVIGAGVAGLQAIATAKRLGARVEAFDTRQEVEEQVQSLGAKFVKIDLGKTESTQQGYAKALTEEQLERQRALMLETCAHSDIVITTAKVFGRKAPLIINQAMLNAMKPGSVVVDLAVEAGGNTEGLVLGENTQTENGVYLLGEGYWERKVAASATQMLAANFFALIQHLWNAETKTLQYDENETILKACWCIKEGQQR